MNNLPLQQIFYGAPGTGKSHAIEEIVKSFPHVRITFHPDSDYSSFVGTYKPTMLNNNPQNQLALSVEELAEKLKTYYNDPESKKTMGLQKFCLDFYPYFKDGNNNIDNKKLLELAGVPTSYDVEIYKYLNLLNQLPTQENKVVYKFVPQAFLKAYCMAWKQIPQPLFLVIEEINRGNCAQIFGDLFQLLDRDENGYSKYGVIADADIQQFLCSDTKTGFGNISQAQKKKFLKESVWQGSELLLPPNLHILASMNTSDQSLFPMDSAFKRRWDWKYVKITNGYKRNEDGGFIKDANGNKIPLHWKIEIRDKEGQLILWWSFLKKINEIIASMTSSADKQLGYYFCTADKKQNDVDESKTVISLNTFVNKVLFYLWNDVFKDYGFEDATLFRYKCKDEEEVNDKDLSFPDFYDDEGEEVNVERVTDFVLKVMAWRKGNEDRD